MTDNEIIKALECCLLDNKQHDERCSECPMYETPLIVCQNLLAYHSLNLINRQKAAIEELEAKIDKQYEQAKADILGNMSDGGTSCHWCIDQHRAAAIKEFAERLKDTLGYGWLLGSAVKTRIDNLAKEMVGDN